MIDPIIGGALIGGGASLIGGLLGNKSRQSIAEQTNQLNAEQFAEMMGFNAEQAGLSRAFSAEQAALMRSFNAAEADKNRNWSSAEALKGREFNSAEALLARQFLERMSNTQHQRAIKDLRAAGLNPILAAHGGNVVSSSPSAQGSIASSQAASAGMPSSSQASASGAGTYRPYDYQDPFGPAINTGADIHRLNADIANIQSDIQLKEQQVSNLAEQLELTKTQTRQGEAAIGKISAEVGEIIARTEKTGKEADHQDIVNALDQAFLDWARNNPRMYIADRTGTELTPTKVMDFIWKGLNLIFGVDNVPMPQLKNQQPSSGPVSRGQMGRNR